MTSDSLNSSLKNLASGALLSLVFGVIGYAMMFVFKVFAARHFGPEKFGIFEMANTILWIGAIFSLWGIHAGVSRYISVYEEKKEDAKLNGYLRFIFRLPVTASIFVSLAVFIFAPAINNFFNFGELFVSVLRIIAFIVPLRVVNEIVYQIFYAKNKILVQNVGYNIIERAILLTGLCIVFLFNLDFLYLVYILFVSFFIAFVFNLWYLRYRIKFNKTSKVVSNYKGWLKFSLPLFFANIFAFVINWTDNLVIGKMMTSAELGIYAASFSLSSFVLFFQTSFIGVFVPITSRIYAKKDDLGFSTIYQKAQNWVFSLSLPFVLLLVFYAEDIIRVLYGEEFTGGSSSLIILSIGFIIYIYMGMNASIMRIVKKTGTLFKVKLLVGILNIIFNIILVQRFGIIGAAISTGFVLALEDFIYLLKNKKIFRLSHNHVFNLKIVLLGIPLILLSKATINIFAIKLELMSLVILIAIYLVLFGFIAMKIKMFDKTDLDLFNSLTGLKVKYKIDEK